MVNLIQRNIEGYRRSFKKYGVSPRALQWVNKEAQEVRFRELLTDLNLEEKSILDVGCGFGDIIPFIKTKTKRFEYTGVDLVPEFVEIAKERFPKYRFLVRDYFRNPLDEKFDIIITSGTLNANIGNALTYRKKAIKIMFNHARQAVAFNMAGGHPQPENKKSNKVYYVDSLDLLKFCLSLTNKVIFRHCYRDKDFTVVLFRYCKNLL